MVAFAYLVITEYALIWYASSNLIWLRAVVGINMVLITLYGAKLVEVLGYTSNLGSVCYVGAMTGQTMILMAGRRDIALGGIKIILFSLICIILIGSIIGQSPIVPGNEPSALAIGAVTKVSVRIVTSSFIAFTLAMFVLVWTFGALSKWPMPARCFGAQVLAQIVDSALFFPIAFGNKVEVVEIALTGVVFKLVLTLIMLPILFMQREKVS
jgi:uncharacterized PurR-regulated membrane protein YhhQ (DUF165 family)